MDYSLFTVEAIERFRLRIDVGAPSECWHWRGAILSTGYGLFSWYDRRTKTIHHTRAHRFAYWLEHGTIAGHVCHTCDVPSCVNPAHLLDRDGRWNVADRQAKGRQARGERVNTARLTARDVLAIREHASTETRRALAREYGVSDVTIGHIARNVTWRHV